MEPDTARLKRAIIVPKTAMLALEGDGSFGTGGARFKAAQAIEPATQLAASALRMKSALGRLALDADGDQFAFARLTQGTADGVVKSLNNINAMMVISRDMEKLKDAASAIDSDFVVVDDFDLAMPSAGLRYTEFQKRHFRTTDAKADREMREASGTLQAHRSGIRGDNVAVGILDTGVDADHVEFRGRRVLFRHIGYYPGAGEAPRIVRGFDTDGHGTHVAGILTGRKVGVAPGALLHCASVIESETMRTSMVRTVYGLNWMLGHLKLDPAVPAVLNLSLGFPAVDNVDEKGHKTRLATIRYMIKNLIANDILVVSAIGNEGPGTCGFPAAFDEVLAVGAVDAFGRTADFSGSCTTGGTKKPDIMGFGVNVLSAVERDVDGRSLYTRMSGTSMAAPYVAGIATLYRSAYPNEPVSAIIDMIRSTAIYLGKSTQGAEAGLAAFQTNP
ncbi:S8 family peptidase [Prosthecodimorpha staleyi]|uniref:S8 family serine peptidase n=1 Tax=Prosthecodimorpha staleyi TaxID=2840188 RepID=A0A947D793_9HYPH|nr:S8 family serine peptidase [Prosthecodimorpha staleyi]MBT9289387.1 S8 family serine peptidase [Prosthecodimorpha staleyi]